MLGLIQKADKCRKCSSQFSRYRCRLVEPRALKHVLTLGGYSLEAALHFSQTSSFTLTFSTVAMALDHSSLSTQVDRGHSITFAFVTENDLYPLKHVIQLGHIKNKQLLSPINSVLLMLQRKKKCLTGFSLSGHPKKALSLPLQILDIPQHVSCHL